MRADSGAASAGARKNEWNGEMPIHAACILEWHGRNVVRLSQPNRSMPEIRCCQPRTLRLVFRVKLPL